ncbi:MAG: hypothetical protein J7M14_03415 [Planctomycetes bacterium]|nr:hypothetical protein [Planctomycetota bacterium]
MRIAIITLLMGIAVVPGCRAAVEGEPIARPLQTTMRKQPWQYPHGIGVLITTDHYHIYTSVTDSRLLNRLPGFLEAAYEHYLFLSNLSPACPQAGAKRMDVYMLASRQEWANLTRWIVGAHAPHLSIGAGGYSHKGVGVYWDLRRRATFSIAAHEGFHQFFYHRMRHGLPMWLEEGLCVTAEGFHMRPDSVVFEPRHNPARFGALRTAIIQDRWIPVDKLLGMDAGDVITETTEGALSWYGQLWALALFLRSSEEYKGGLQRLLAAAEAGEFHRALNVPKAALERLQQRGRLYNRVISRKVFEYYITDDLVTFEQRYRHFARKLAKIDD